MTLTIGRHWPGDAPRGDHEAKCDYCDATWRRSQLKLDRSGLLYCPDEGSGRDTVTLDKMNQAASQQRMHSNRRYNRGGDVDPPAPLQTETVNPWSIFATDPDDGSDASSGSLEETDLEVWLDMRDTVVNDLGRVSLCDKGPGAHVYSQSPGDLAPTVSGSSLAFTGGQRLELAGNLASTRWLHNGTGGLAIKFTPASLVGTQVLTASGATVNGATLGIATSNMVYQGLAAGAATILLSGSMSAGVSQWWLGSWSEEASPETVLYRDGVLVDSGPSLAAPSNGASDIRMTIGTGAAGSNPYTGTIRAIVGFSGGNPSATQISQLGTYFDGLP